MARTKEFQEEAVLEKAMRLFWEKGYEATSMQDIVDYLGLSRSSIYDTFGDKHQLFVQSLKRYKQEESGKILKMLQETSDYKATLIQIFEYLVQKNTCGTAQKGCFMVNSSVELALRDTEVAKIVCGNINDLENIFTEAIQKGQAAGQIAAKLEAKALAHFLMNTISGMNVAASAGVGKDFLEDILKVVAYVL